MNNNTETNFVPVVIVIAIAIVVGIISFIVVVSDHVDTRAPVSIEGK